MQAGAGTSDTDSKWKFAQCFGDKGESDNITEGSLLLPYGVGVGERTLYIHDACYPFIAWDG